MTPYAIPADWRLVTRAIDGQVQYVNMWYVVRIVLNGAGGSTLFFDGGSSTEIVELPDGLLPPPVQAEPFSEPEPEDLGPDFVPDDEPEPAIMASP